MYRSRRTPLGKNTAKLCAGAVRKTQSGRTPSEAKARLCRLTNSVSIGSSALCRELPCIPTCSVVSPPGPFLLPFPCTLDLAMRASLFRAPPYRAFWPPTQLEHGTTKHVCSTSLRARRNRRENRRWSRADLRWRWNGKRGEAGKRVAACMSPRHVAQHHLFRHSFSRGACERDGARTLAVFFDGCPTSSIFCIIRCLDSGRLPPRPTRQIWPKKGAAAVSSAETCWCCNY